MNKTEIEKKLSINKARQEIIEAFLVCRKKSDEFTTIIQLSRDRKKDLMEKFNVTPMQVYALLDLKKPITEIPIESIENEKQRLIDEQVELENSLPK